MRNMSLLIAGAAFAACTASTQQATMSVQAQAKYDSLLAGRVPGKPMSCLPTLQANDMVVIDDNTIAYKAGARVYINHPVGGCPQISQGHSALVSRQYAQTGPCSGDVVEVVDTLSHIAVGSCTLGDFTPYMKQGR
jgi:hypothetical protein